VKEENNSNDEIIKISENIKTSFTDKKMNEYNEIVNNLTSE